MIARLQKIYAVIAHKIIQRFRLADALKRIAQNRLDQLKSAQGKLAIRFDPETQVFNKLCLKDCFALLFTQALPHDASFPWLVVCLDFSTPAPMQTESSQHFAASA